MMVDDDNVTLHRPPPHLGDETSLPRAALLTQATLSSGIELVPEKACFRQRYQFRPVSGLGSFLPGRDRAVVLNFLESRQYGVFGQVIKLFPAKIVVTPLHVADAELVLAG